MTDGWCQGLWEVNSKSSLWKEKRNGKNLVNLESTKCLTECLEATNLLDEGRKKKNWEDVKTHKLQQISGCAAAAVKLFKGHVLSCKSLKSEMFILHSYSVCWAINNEQWTRIALWKQVHSLCLTCLREWRTWRTPSLPDLWVQWMRVLPILWAVERECFFLSPAWQRPSSSPHAVRDISYLSFLFVLYTIPSCRAKYGTVIIFIILVWYTHITFKLT